MSSGSSTSAIAVRSSSHELTTDPRRQTSAISGSEQVAEDHRYELPLPAFFMMSKPSA